jgi:hypothetical protein
MIKLLLLGWVLTTTLACVWIIKYFIKESKDSKNKQRAEKWFSDRGIDVNVDPSTLNEPNPLFTELSTTPTPFFGPNAESPEIESIYDCRITITSLIFYTWCYVTFYDFRNDKTYWFEGGSGGIGFGGADGWGLIYYGNQKKLLEATVFGLAFGGVYEGLAQVTWGTSGNATAGLLGSGVGAFGGSGEWKVCDGKNCDGKIG